MIISVKYPAAQNSFAFATQRIHLLRSTALTSLLLLGGASAAYGQQVVDNGTILTIPGDLASPTTLDSFTVGSTGKGTLNLNPGGNVVSASAVIGEAAGSNGTVTAAGDTNNPAIWSVSNAQTVGDAGNGTLSIGAGGKVTAFSVVIGSQANSVGTVTLSNGGIFASATGMTIAKDAASTGTLNIGAPLGQPAAPAGTVGYADSISQFVNDFWGPAQAKIAFGAGQGSLVFNHTGNPDGSGVLFHQILSGAGTIINAAGDTTFSAASPDFTGDLKVAGGTLHITGAFNSGTGSVGSPGGNGEGVLTVEGAGATWTSSIMTDVGDGSAGTLKIGAGGTVVNKGVTLIGNTSSGSVLVAGKGALMDNQAGSDIGLQANGELTIGAGGTVKDTDAFVGFDTGGDGRVSVAATDPATGAYVAGQTATWQIANNVIVGDQNTLSGVLLGSVTVGPGGVVNSGATVFGDQPGAQGKATVAAVDSSGAQIAGATAVWHTGALNIGYQGDGALTVGPGGQVSAGAVLVGALGGSTGTLTLNGGELSAASMTIARDIDSIGTLNIGAAPGATPATAGVLDPPPITFGAGNGTINFNHTGNPDGSDYTFASPIGGAGTVNFLNGVTVMTVSSTYSGPTTVTGPATLAALGTNVLSPNSDYALVGGGVLDLRQGAQIVSSLSNGGVVKFSDAAGPGQVLTVNGAYTSNSGQLAMRTVLGTDNSVTDRLVVGSVAVGTGATKISVTNVGGLGKLTTGDGVKLVQVNGGLSASAADAFTLDGTRVAAGAYEYTLQQNGVGADTGDGNWYLRSTFTAAPPNTPQQGTSAPNDLSSGASKPAADETGNTSSTDPGVLNPVSANSDATNARPDASTTSTGDALPDFRSEVAVDTVLPALASRLGLEMLGTRDDRTGRIGDSSGNTSHIWARVFGESGSFRRDGGNLQTRLNDFEANGPSYDMKLGGIQIGADIFNDPRSVAGLYAGVATVSSNVDDIYRGMAGAASMNAYSLGAYWTRTDTSGWYLDGVGQVSLLDQASTYSREHEGMKTGGSSVIASLETGYPFALGGNWTIEPQLQAIYQHTDLRSSQDSFGLVDFGATDDAYGRAGAVLSRTFLTQDNAPITAWVRANIRQSLGAAAKTTFSTLDGADPVSFNTDLGGTMAQTGLGISTRIVSNISLYASGDYETRIDGPGSDFAARIGISYAPGN
jgi:outer membrane autotransporter protein